jgi:hypothetical protein
VILLRGADLFGPIPAVVRSRLVSIAEAPVSTARIAHGASCRRGCVNEVAQVMHKTFVAGMVRGWALAAPAVGRIEKCNVFREKTYS